MLIAGEDAGARGVISRALRESGGFEVINEAGTADEAVAMASAFAPHVVLLDVPTAGAEVCTVVRTILREAPEARIVVLSAEPCEQLGLETLRAGAVGFLARKIDSSALVRALNGVAGGEAAISRGLATWLVTRAREEPERRMGMRPVKSRLTTREWEVLDLVSAGISKAAIARDLSVTLGTVRSHLRNLSRKLAIDGSELVDREWWRPGQGDAATN